MARMKQLRPLLAASAIAMLPLTAAWAEAVPAALQQPAVQSPKALGAAMLAVTRAGGRLVAGGERGTILLSDDGGTHWQQAQVPVKTSLTAVQFVNEKSGWAVGHLGVVLHTNDGGKTWLKQLDGIAAAQLALETAKKAGDEKAVADAEHLVADGPDKPFLDLYFENEQTGYIVGAYNLMFKTSDGGQSWQPWQSHVANPKGLLLRSTDGGASFTALESPYKGTYFGMVTAKSGEVVVFGLRGNAFRSEDGGNSWQKVETGVQAALVAGTEAADGALVLVSQGGDVLVSRDKGKTFAPQKGEPLPLAAVALARDNSLIVAGLRGVKRLALAQQ